MYVYISFFDLPLCEFYDCHQKRSTALIVTKNIRRLTKKIK